MIVDRSKLAEEHLQLGRRYFLSLGAVGALAWHTSILRGAEGAKTPALTDAIGKLKYLTLPQDFGTVERGTPLPSSLSEDKLREAGLTQETWKLEVIADPDSTSKIESPISHEAGNALDWAGLMQQAEKHAVRFLKIMTCNNGGRPLGMGLWEGVPLRDVLWLTKPTTDVRRVFYYGFHNNDIKQRFQSSLPIGRVLEDPPGEHPVILCYKLNGEYLSVKRGGPVRMVVPDAYGFKSVKWLQRVLLTNSPFGNDTYANGNNDVDSYMKTFARFIAYPKTIKPGEAWPITGLTQVGVSGLTRVQWWLQPSDAKWPADDPHFARAPWQDAEILSPPEKWEGGLTGSMPSGTRNFSDDGHRPTHWPQRYALAHWAALIPPQPVGKYQLRCRTIDANGVAQPMPRPFPKSGRNNIESVEVAVAE